jgi:dihydrofolate reductase
MLKLALIAAVSDNGVIGNNNTLPWHLPEDLQYFKQRTIGKAILMGRKTYQSIGKPLPNRDNIILTNNKHFNSKRFKAPCTLVHSIEQAKTIAQAKGHSELMVIGGAQLYELTLAQADILYLTYVHQEVQGDTFFPPVDLAQWTIERQPRMTSKTGIDYSFAVLTRISNNII